MFNRLRVIVRSMINHLLGRAESHLALPQMDQAFREMQEKLAIYKQAVAQALAHEKRVKRQLDERQQAMANVMAQAKEAVRCSVQADEPEKSRCEQLAKRALQQHAEFEKGMEPLQRTWEKAHETAMTAKQNFDLSAEEVGKRARQLNEAHILHNLNKSRREILKLSAEINLESSTAVFDQGLDHIQTETDKLEALEQLSLPDGQRFDKELERLSATAQINNQYNQMVKELQGKEQPKLPKPADADTQT